MTQNGLKPVTLLIAVCTVLAVAVAGFGSTVDVRSGMKWPDSTIKIAVSESFLAENGAIKNGSDTQSAILRSIAIWEKAANIKFEVVDSEAESVSPQGLAGDGISLITIAGTAENVLMFQGDAVHSPASTRIFRDRDGTITEADIVLNPTQQFSTDGTFGTYDLESVVTHEIGHMLGLEHSTLASSTMFYGIPKNGLFGDSSTYMRSLSAADITAIRSMYGLDVEKSTDCCGSLSGRLTIGNARAAAAKTVLIEDLESGFVIAKVQTDTAGRFRVEGLEPRRVSVRFLESDGTAMAGSDGPSIVDIEVGSEAKLMARRASVKPQNFTVAVGLNGQLTDAAVSFLPQTTRRVYVGFPVKPAGEPTFNIASQFLSVGRNSIAIHSDYDGMWVVSFEVTSHQDTPAGEYSISVNLASGQTIYLPGIISLDR
jgi:predicted Zn-dependent protease